MDAEQLALARRLAAHPRFEWRRGTLALYVPDQYCDGSLRVEEDGWSPQWCGYIARPDGWPDAKREAWPDLADDATGGVLLGVLDYTRFGWLVAISVKHGVRRWAVYERGDAEPGMGWCPTLAEACARALLVEWGEP